MQHQLRAEERNEYHAIIPKPSNENLSEESLTNNSEAQSEGELFLSGTRSDSLLQAEGGISETSTLCHWNMSDPRASHRSMGRATLYLFDHCRMCVHSAE